ncbi:TniQ family protein [Acinetobacter baumannii]|uniref:TniQ family protein n=1 Tax=Acinetobacter baumannii TaxID=470 RepID=UPI001C0BA921|nr:TniQ family protein [Acinetobacter baumannii]MBU3082499.1 TniQ family protein [Acinetobacter baumannii]
MLSGHILPAHPHPLNDELFSSWFTRLAFSNLSKIHSFAIEIFGKDKGGVFWNRDIDCFINLEEMDYLSFRTGIDTKKIYETSIRSYEGILFQRFNSNGFNRWILPCGIYHRTRRSNWLVYCPICLSSDKEPYFRKSWRLAFYTICPIHHIYMHDACPKCKNPITFFRQELGKREKYKVESIANCYYCQFNLRDTNYIPLGDEKEYPMNQINLIKYHKPGWWILKHNQESLPYSFSYYDVVHYLCSFLSSKIGFSLYEYVSRIVKLNLVMKKNKKVFETRILAERNNLLNCALWLIEDWPHRFISLCKKYKLTESRITRSEQLPYWFHKEISFYLKGTIAIQYDLY